MSFPRKWESRNLAKLAKLDTRFHGYDRRIEYMQKQKDKVGADLRVCPDNTGEHIGSPLLPCYIFCVIHIIHEA